MNHKGTKTIETEHLMLRKLKEDDAQQMFKNWAGDPQATQYQSWETHASAEDTLAAIKRMQEKKHKDRRYWWGVEDKERAGLIGEIRVTRIVKNIKGAELSFCFSRSLADQALAGEAIHVVCRFLLGPVDFNRVEVVSAVDDRWSQEILETEGFHFEGIKRQGRRIQQGLSDGRVYSLLDQDLVSKD